MGAITPLDLVEALESFEKVAGAKASQCSMTPNLFEELKSNAGGAESLEGGSPHINGVPISITDTLAEGVYIS